MTKRWTFNDDRGGFELTEANLSNSLYFPLANESGMMSAISPTGGGDSKTGQNTFFLLPVSADDLTNLKSGRNFWVHTEGRGAWSCVGASAAQAAAQFEEGSGETSSVRAGFLWHTIVRESARMGLKAETTSFVPAGCGRTELMRVVITNIGAEAVTITPTAAIPIYGRSADNVRDHRHVTGLLGRARTVPEGVELLPAMTFDERGHRPNTLCYSVYGAEGNSVPPVGTFPATEDFTGEGGSLEWPEAIVKNRRDVTPAGTAVDGLEITGALRFCDETLTPGESASFIVLMAITDGHPAPGEFAGMLSAETFARLLNETEAFWREKLGKTQFISADSQFDLWMRWVTLQPILRRIYGCSFMPHHDYGRGGRGWRDLWQDCLALLLLEPETARSQLLNNFGGVRLDGTNATIIGSAPGEFIADRNNISRVWSDHGVWPAFTTLLYLNNTGDLDFLFEQQTYFKDRLAMRCREVDDAWTPEYGNRQWTAGGTIYTGTILEHLMLQNLTAFFNVGAHNNVRLENADWNDAMDLAWDRGEAVAFTSFYAGNLLALAGLVRDLARLRPDRPIEVGCEIMTLLDTLGSPVDYDSAEAKRAALLKYYALCRHTVTGGKAPVDAAALAADLEKKALWMMDHVRRQEWIRNKDGYQWFNGYYDNAGRPVEGDHPSGVRMTLTGQTFPIMMGIATDEQVKQAAEACRHYLYDEALGGYRLNTDFHEVKLDMGRCFGFAFGHKENGAVFSHMAVMYAAALYRRGFVREGWHVLKSLYNLSVDFERARIYPGIPEYFNARGRGMYHYLTGSASWMLFVMLNQAYGVGGRLGDLAIEPKLVAEQFDREGEASVRTMFAGRRIRVTYRNDGRLDYGAYRVGIVRVDGRPVECSVEPAAVVIGRGVIQSLDEGATHDIEIILAVKEA